MVTGGDAAEAAEAIRRLVEVVERGEVEADSPQARRLLRRFEGAFAAWEPRELIPPDDEAR